MPLRLVSSFTRDYIDPPGESACESAYRLPPPPGLPSIFLKAHTLIIPQSTPPTASQPSDKPPTAIMPDTWTNVHVAIYRPKGTGYLCHWALWLESPTESVIFQLADNMYGYGYIVDDPIETVPWKSNSCQQIVFCGTIPKGRHDHSCNYILNHPIRNGFWNWSCQNWVLECLEELERRQFLKGAPRESKEYLRSKLETRLSML